MIRKNNNNNLDLGNDDIYKLLLNLSIPAILSMVVAAAYNMVDRIFVGNVNPLGLSSIGVTMPFQIMQMAFVLLIGVGASTLISIKYGQGDLYKAKMLLSSAFKMIVVTEIIITILCLVFLDKIFVILNISDDIYQLSKDYIVIILLGGVPSLTGYCLNNIVRSLGFSKESMIIVIASSLINIVLDWLFVIVLDMQIKGAAIATVISQTFVTLFVLYFFCSKNTQSPIKLEFDIFKRQNLKKDYDDNILSYAKNIISNGLPNFYMQIFGTFVNIALNNSILKYGNDYHLASITIISSISLFFTMIIYGVSQGMQPIVGFNYGNKKIYRSVQSVKISLAFVVFISSLGLLMIEKYPSFFTSFFTRDLNLRQIANHNLKIYLLGLPMIAIHSITTTFLQSVKMPRFSTFLYILRYGGILIPCLMIFPNYLGIDGVYISNAISNIVSGLVALIILYMSVKKIKLE